MLPWLREGYANPSGSYAAAKAARAAIDRAREQVAELIGAEPEEIVFTGCGTESVNTALRSLDALCGPGGGGGFRHRAQRGAALCGEACREVSAACRWMPAGGWIWRHYAAILDGAAFVSIMAANNETGVIQPLARSGGTGARRGDCRSIRDAVQAVGKIPLDVRELGVDLLSLSAHKFHGPKGVGALYVRRGLKFEPLLRGGGQEAGRRSGTENTAGIVGMGAAAACAMSYLRKPVDAIARLRDAFEQVVAEIRPGVTVNGDPAHRLPNTSHLSFDQCDAAGLLILLDEAGVACSAGSACMTGKQRPSHVQLAMGIPEARGEEQPALQFFPPQHDGGSAARRGPAGARGGETAARAGSGRRAGGGLLAVTRGRVAHSLPRARLRSRTLSRPFPRGLSTWSSSIPR